MSSTFPTSSSYSLLRLWLLSVALVNPLISLSILLTRSFFSFFIRKPIASTHSSVRLHHYQQHYIWSSLANLYVCSFTILTVNILFEFLPINFTVSPLALNFQLSSDGGLLMNSWDWYRYFYTCFCLLCYGYWRHEAWRPIPIWLRCMDFICYFKSTWVCHVESKVLIINRKYMTCGWIMSDLCTSSPPFACSNID